MNNPDGVFNSEDNTFITGTFQKLVHLHAPSLCKGSSCVIHNPSNHCMRHLPTHWRVDRGIFERICEHGVGHPDPDCINAMKSPVHGCDGCCSK